MFRSMVVISMKADDMVHMWFGYSPEIELELTGGALYRDGKAIINDVSLVNVGLYKYQEIPTRYDEALEELEEIPWYLYELGLVPASVDDLPLSEHIGQLKAVNPANTRPATVRRRFMGANYDVSCLVTQSVADMYQSGGLVIDDFVLVSFIEEIPNTSERHIAIVTDKIYKSWS
jgi:hypothetical protein